MKEGSVKDVAIADAEPIEGPGKVAFKMPKKMLRELRQTVLHAQRQDPAISLTSVLLRGAQLVKAELDKKYGPAPVGESVKLRTGRRLQA